MSAKKIILAVFVAVIAVGAIFLVLPKDQQDTADPTPSGSNTTQSEGNSSPDPSQAETASTYAAAQVAEHNTASDCWTIIDGSVYDLTPFISSHPGGDEILRACGQDATTLFNQRETASGEEVGSGTPHSSSARSQLERLKIGILAD